MPMLFFSKLMKAGYEYFIVWDDPGHHVVSTSSLDVLKDLNRYLFRISQSDGAKSICNYDVLCLHPRDSDVYRDVTEWYRSH